MAAPSVVFSPFHNTGTNRIQMDVANQFQEVRIGINQNSFIAALKQMSPSSFSPIYPDRVTLTEILKNSRERNFLYLQDEMNMVCHQAEGMNEMGKFLLALLKKEVKPVAILIT